MRAWKIIEFKSWTCYFVSFQKECYNFSLLPTFVSGVEEDPSTKVAKVEVPQVRPVVIPNSLGMAFPPWSGDPGRAGVHADVKPGRWWCWPAGSLWRRYGGFSAVKCFLTFFGWPESAETVMNLEGLRFCSFFFHSSSCFVHLITRKAVHIVGF